MGGFVYILGAAASNATNILATCGASPSLCVQIWGVPPMSLF